MDPFDGRSRLSKSNSPQLTGGETQSAEGIGIEPLESNVQPRSASFWPYHQSQPGGLNPVTRLNNEIGRGPMIQNKSFHQSQPLQPPIALAAHASNARMPKPSIPINQMKSMPRSSSALQSNCVSRPNNQANPQPAIYPPNVQQSSFRINHGQVRASINHSQMNAHQASQPRSQIHPSGFINYYASQPNCNQHHVNTLHDCVQSDPYCFQFQPNTSNALHRNDHRQASISGRSNKISPIHHYDHCLNTVNPKPHTSNNFNIEDILASVTEDIPDAHEADDCNIDDILAAIPNRVVFKNLPSDANDSAP